LRLIASTALLAVALSAVPVHAYGRPIPWAEVTGRFGTYAMDDVNREIRSIDAAIYARFDEITSGYGLGAAVGVLANPATSLAVRYERLFAKSEASDYSGSITYDLGGNAFYATAEYRTPSSGKAVFGSGVGAGIVSLAGEASISLSGVGAVTGDLGGSGPLFQGYLFAEIPIGPRVTMVPLAGYRYAKVASVEIEGQPLYNPDGSDYSADYSGIVVAVGFRFYSRAH
jgi:hypothetical protein